MKGASAAFKVGLTALLIGVIGFFSFRFVAKGIGGEKGYEVYALFRDATGLVDKSRVQIAGLTVGDIAHRRLQDGRARVTIRMRPEAELWSNAAVMKKSSSLLGEFYLELDPGTHYSVDAVTGLKTENYLLKDCEAVTHKPDCNQINSVIEAVTASDIMVQMNETMPVLKDILTNVRKMTEGPIQEMLKEMQGDLNRNAHQLETLLAHIDDILGDVRGITGGPASEDLRKSMENVRQITEGIKGLVGSGEGQMNTTGDKLKRDLDALHDTLLKVNSSLDNVNGVSQDVKDITGRVSAGEGTIGRLLKDDAIAENVNSISDDAATFVRSLTHLQTLVGVREEYYWNAQSFKTYLTLRLQPRPDKYYLIEVIDDPRGSYTYSHQFQVVSGGDATKQGAINYDTWNRSSSFRVSFMFAKRIEPWGLFGITGRLGIKESTGGLGLDFDFWRQRLTLNIDVFDFTSEAPLPRVKVMAALQLFEHAWLVGGMDDILNESNKIPAPKGGVTCGPATPLSWCKGGRDYFFGAQLTFNDEDLRALLTVGAGALAGAGGK